VTSAVAEDAPGTPAVPDAPRALALARATDLARRILTRGRPAASRPDGLPAELAVEALSRAWPPGARRSVGGRAAEVVELTALVALHHLVGDPGRVPIPSGLAPGDVFDEDVRGSDDLEEELWGDGVPLGELAAVLGSERRGPRVTGLCVLAAGLGVTEAAELLGRDEARLRGDLRHLGRRWCDRRRLGLDPDVPEVPGLDAAEVDGDGTRPAAPAAVAPSVTPEDDLSHLLAVADARARRRRRRRGGAAGIAAAVLLAVPAAVVLVDDGPPEQVETVAGPTTTAPTTTSTTASTVPVTVPVTAPPAPVATTTAPTTVPATTTTTLPPTTAPPANQPLRATLEVLTPQVQAGATASLRVSWSDPDLADPDVRIVDVWGDPEVFLAFEPSTRPACEAPGPGGSGTRDLRFRYTTPGTYTVSVVLTACDGNGTFGERAGLTATVEVLAPTVAGTPGRAVVAVVDAGGPDAESAVATFTPTGGPAVVLDAREPAVALRAPGGAPGSTATVLRLPDGAVGELRLEAGGSCRTATVDLSSTIPLVPRVVLDRPC
jgi:hypothetical protein